jgi:diguanylate cyclase (GGDEF)-like protein
LQVRHVSARLAQVTGRDVAAITGTFPAALAGGTVQFEEFAGSPLETLNQLVRAHQPFRDLVVPVLVQGVETFWSLSGKPVFDRDGHFTGYHGVGSDISSERRQQKQISYLAQHDTLTGLPNRALFNATFEQACLEAGAESFALLYLDLDHFKAINESHGYDAGDAVLKAASGRLRQCLEGEGLLARLAGDEFTIIWPGADSEALETLCSRIVAALSEPFVVRDETVTIGISIGIVQAPQDGTQPSELLKHADFAMHLAKSDGRGVWRFYDPAMDERLQARRMMRQELHQALGNGEFRVAFQPMMDLARNRIAGAEALLRWCHPVRGMMPPGEFIPLAEETGLIGPIGEWVLNEACRTAAGWPSHIAIAVNLSPVQFRDTGLVRIIAQALETSGLAPGRLELEITEGTLFESNSANIAALREIHALGVRVALDDFGTGYSSLSYLRRFPFHKIKIDRSFVRDLSAESDDSSIVLAILGLAERLGMVVTAEGVETVAQAELLNGFRCKLAQGFLFSRPVPAETIAALLAAEAGRGVVYEALMG